MSQNAAHALDCWFVTHLTHLGDSSLQELEASTASNPMCVPPRAELDGCSVEALSNLMP